ncbi:helix-turn-helix domain-containing protein [Methylocystis suflitae]|uniref:helix-turn-helix domain-containing protein n=1 Tax=Methylocystis suflitae TaxID=2951405 RepID=UPI0021091AA1|nr:helix-turn-helix domain-containing protein [Methylocystis suflitae]MCQ4188110.1 helix-turn-helix domain-containing protein [Methylocystis suflitae]
MSFVENVASVTLAERLDYGYVTIKEVCALKLCGTTTVYADIKAGVLKVEKHGRSTRISGPLAKAYVPGSRHLNGEAA